MAVLVLDRVVKRFGDFTALDALSFSVPEGGVFGFLGGNGAGKTTSVRLMLDIIRPTSGHIEVLGRAPSRAFHAHFCHFSSPLPASHDGLSRAHHDDAAKGRPDVSRRFRMIRFLAFIACLGWVIVALVLIADPAVAAWWQRTICVVVGLIWAIAAAVVARRGAP